MRYFFVALSFSVPGLFAGELNSLTEAEQKAGWQLLFDGKISANTGATLARKM